MRLTSRGLLRSGGFSGAGDVARPLKVDGPCALEELHQPAGRGGPAISAFLQSLEEITLPEGAHGDREMRHALVAGERVSEGDECGSLIHVCTLAMLVYSMQDQYG